MKPEIEISRSPHRLASRRSRAHTRPIRRALFASGSAAVISMAASQAFAQSAAPADTTKAEAATSTVTEVVVTAQRRGERLQDVPIAIAAFGTESLTQSHVTDLQDLTALVPGFQGPGDDGNETVHLRGVGNEVGGVGIDNSVSLYIDGVYIATPTPGLYSLADAKNVEVLKGPQGTLFGRNATGGLIQVTTRGPGLRPELDGQVSYGNYDTVSGNFFAAAPLTDELGASISVQALHQGEGYGTNLYDGRKTVRTDFELELRAKLEYHPTERTDLLLALDYQQDRAPGEGAFRQVPGTINPLTTVREGSSPWDLDDNDVATNHFRSGGASLRITHDFDFAKFSSITAYRRLSSSQIPLDYDVSPLPAVRIDVQHNNYQISQELNLTSPSRGPLQWTTGIYYYGGRDTGQNDYTFGPPITFQIPFSGQSIYGTTSTVSVSAFAQASYEFLPRTKLTLGGRFTTETRRFYGFENATLLAGIVVPLVPPLTGTVTYNVPTWRVAIDHKLTSDDTIYASVSRGFKSGGFNYSLTTNPPFKPEYLTAFEIGSKNILFDRRLRLNASLFYYDYSDIQVQGFSLSGSDVYNGAGAKLYGADVDAEFHVTHALTLTAALEALHSEFTSFPNAVLNTPLPMGGFLQYSGSAEGKRLPQAPSFTSTLLGNYRWDTPIGAIDATASWTYNSGYYFEPDNRLHQRAYSLIDASVLLTSPGEHYTVRLWGHNLTNRAVASFEATSTLTTGQILNAPRTFGVTVGFK